LKIKTFLFIDEYYGIDIFENFEKLTSHHTILKPKAFLLFSILRSCNWKSSDWLESWTVCAQDSFQSYKLWCVHFDQ